MVGRTLQRIRGTRNRKRNRVTPSWLGIRRGTLAGKPEKYVRIDRVVIRMADGTEQAINGCVATIRQNGVTRKRTCYRNGIKLGFHPLWLLEQNGLGFLVDKFKPKAKAAKAAKA